MWEKEQGPEKNQNRELREGGSGPSADMNPAAGFLTKSIIPPAMTVFPSVKWEGGF